MEKNTKDSGVMAACMAKVHLNGPTVNFMKVSTKWIREMAMVYMPGKMVRSMPDSGKTTKDTGEASSNIQMGHKEKECGKTIGRQTGKISPCLSYTRGCWNREAMLMRGVITNCLPDHFYEC